MDSFDASQSALLLKNLTGGLGIALLTTVTGLSGNILLGLQLMRLDRFADALMADTLAATQRHPATQEPPHGDRPPGP
jgi:biopolymer transport protein ExbB/TolQ